eukprot:gb/GECG01003506.1/.p1 GENE.gb/GECG01003506.1/~~gb/GECG01003506.1/.p1  ORF type:complete len:134 (+),score=11.58 gb/GECG01003506.1/:1-402(+)
MDGFTSFLGPSRSASSPDQYGNRAQESDIVVSHDSPEEPDSYYARIQPHHGGTGGVARYHQPNRQVSPERAPPPINTYSTGNNLDKLTRSQLSLEDFQWQDTSMEQTNFHGGEKKRGVMGTDHRRRRSCTRLS